jgi:hypothetical protein
LSEAAEDLDDLGAAVGGLLPPGLREEVKDAPARLASVVEDGRAVPIVRGGTRRKRMTLRATQAFWMQMLEQEFAARLLVEQLADGKGDHRRPPLSYRGYPRTLGCPYYRTRPGAGEGVRRGSSPLNRHEPDLLYAPARWIMELTPRLWKQPASS